MSGLSSLDLTYAGQLQEQMPPQRTDLPVSSQLLDSQQQNLMAAT
jgi:hypothetical protein